MQGSVLLRRAEAVPAPVEHSVPPSPSPPSPNVTLIYYVQDLPIKLFSNLLPLPFLLCGHISLRFPPCQTLPASPGDIRGSAIPKVTGNMQGFPGVGGCWVLEKTWCWGEPPRAGGAQLEQGCEESWEGSSCLFKAELLML